MKLIIIILLIGKNDTVNIIRDQDNDTVRTNEINENITNINDNDIQILTNNDIVQIILVTIIFSTKKKKNEKKILTNNDIVRIILVTIILSTK